MVTVAGLVVDWSTPHDLENMLASAQRVEDHHIDWYVWRNYHPQFTDDYEAWVYDMAEVTVDAENRGHGAGINRAASLANLRQNYDYYLVINPDCEFRVPIVNELVAFCEIDEKRWAVGPKQLDSRFRITAAGIFGTDREPKHRDWHRPDPTNKYARDAQPAIMVAGSCFLTPAKVFHELGGLLEARHYFSDTWYSYHIRAHGGEVWHYGVPWIVHEWHRSSAPGSPETDGKFKEDQALFRMMCAEHDPPIECE